MLLKTWIEKEFHFAEQPLLLKLKVLSYVEAPPFAKKMEEFRVAEGIEASYNTLDAEWLAEIFAKWVRLVKPVEIEGADGVETIKTGKDLFPIVNPGLVWEILGELNRLSALTAKEGKASGSPSTSPAATAPRSDGSGSRAMTTEGAAGTSA